MFIHDCKPKFRQYAEMETLPAFFLSSSTPRSFTGYENCPVQLNLPISIRNDTWIHSVRAGYPRQKSVASWSEKFRTDMFIFSWFIMGRVWVPCAFVQEVTPTGIKTKIDEHDVFLPMVISMSSIASINKNNHQLCSSAISAILAGYELSSFNFLTLSNRPRREWLSFRLSE